MVGPYLTVSGAVFVNKLICQQLTHYMLIGPRAESVMRSRMDASVRCVAQLFRMLKECLNDLASYYEALSPPPSNRVPSNRTLIPPGSTQPPRGVLALGPIGLDLAIFVPPHLKRFMYGSESFNLVYTNRLAAQYGDKSVFRATFRGRDNEHSVVVKFTASYSKDGHGQLAAAGLAPKLWFCERIENVGGLYVVIMDYIEPVVHFDRSKSQCSEQGIVAQLRCAVQTLHAHDLVFGDLHGPNVMVSGDRVMLIDFDWCGKVGEAEYPSDINLEEIKWHEDVC